MEKTWMRQARRRQQAGAMPEEVPIAKHASQAYGQWFESLPWDWFATFTLPEGSTTKQLLGYHNRWTGRIQAKAGRELRQVFAIEPHRNGTPHGHALIHGIRRALDPADAAGIWKEISGGIARIEPYVPRGGAATYVAKCVRKDGDLQLLGRWPERVETGTPETRPVAPRPACDELNPGEDRAPNSPLDPWVVPPHNSPKRVADKRRLTMRLSALFEEFCHYLRVEKEVSPRTIQTYRWCFGDFVQFATKELGGTVLVTDFTEELCRAYQYDLSARKLQTSSIRVRLATLGSFGKWALRREKLPRNPVELLTRPRRKTRLPRIPTWATVEEVLDRCPRLRDKAILALLAYGGLRRSEVVALDVGDYTPQFGLTRLCGKGDHETAGPLPQVARVILSEYLEKERPHAKPSEPLFLVRYSTRVGSWEERRMSDHRVWKIVKDLGGRGGVPELHPHAFRHGSGVELYRRTGDLRVVQEHLRHRDIQTTTLYTRLTKHDLQKAISVFDRKGD